MRRPSLVLNQSFKNRKFLDGTDDLSLPIDEGPAASTPTIMRCPLLHRVLSFTAGFCFAGTTQIISAQTAAEPLPKPAIEYLVRAFDRYPLVALSEVHGSRETKDFVGKLIRHPDFSGRVADIVVEFGNGRYQRMMDRYIAGEDVAREELKQVWENTTRSAASGPLRFTKASLRMFALSARRCRLHDEFGFCSEILRLTGRL
jgi:hypothetical protein